MALQPVMSCSSAVLLAAVPQPRTLSTVLGFWGITYDHKGNFLNEKELPTLALMEILNTLYIYI